MMSDIRAFIGACLHSDLVQAALPADLCAGVPKALERDRFWIPFYRVQATPEGTFTVNPPMAYVEVSYPGGEILLFERFSMESAPLTVTQREAEHQMAATARYLVNLERYCAGQVEREDLQAELLESAGALAGYYP